MKIKLNIKDPSINQIDKDMESLVKKEFSSIKGIGKAMYITEKEKNIIFMLKNFNIFLLLISYGNRHLNKKICLM